MIQSVTIALGRPILLPKPMDQKLVLHTFSVQPAVLCTVSSTMDGVLNCFLNRKCIAEAVSGRAAGWDVQYSFTMYKVVLASFRTLHTLRSLLILENTIIIDYSITAANMTRLKLVAMDK